MNDRPDSDAGARNPRAGISEDLRAESRKASRRGPAVAAGETSVAAAENLLFAQPDAGPADIAGMIGQLTDSVGRLEQAVADSRDATARDVERLRQAFATLIDLVEQQETERRLTESDWKRQEAERLRAILSAEIESHGKKRRWF